MEGQVTEIRPEPKPVKRSAVKTPKEMDEQRSDERQKLMYSEILKGHQGTPRVLRREPRALDREDLSPLAWGPRGDPWSHTCVTTGSTTPAKTGAPQGPQGGPGGEPPGSPRGAPEGPKRPPGGGPRGLAKPVFCKDHLPSLNFRPRHPPLRPPDPSINIYSTGSFVQGCRVFGPAGGKVGVCAKTYQNSLKRGVQSLG